MAILLVFSNGGKDGLGNINRVWLKHWEFKHLGPTFVGYFETIDITLKKKN